MAEDRGLRSLHSISELVWEVGSNFMYNLINQITLVVKIQFEITVKDNGWDVTNIGYFYLPD